MPVRTHFNIRLPRICLRDGYDIGTIQDLLGHKELSTTMIYTHVLQQHRLGVKSPVDL